MEYDDKQLQQRLTHMEIRFHFKFHVTVFLPAVIAWHGECARDRDPEGFSNGVSAREGPLAASYGGPLSSEGRKVGSPGPTDSDGNGGFEKQKIFTEKLIFGFVQQSQTLVN
jgi:hypothetical protein